MESTYYILLLVANQNMTTPSFSVRAAAQIRIFETESLYFAEDLIHHNLLRFECFFQLIEALLEDQQFSGGVIRCLPSMLEGSWQFIAISWRRRGRRRISGEHFADDFQGIELAHFVHIQYLGEGPPLMQLVAMQSLASLVHHEFPAVSAMSIFGTESRGRLRSVAPRYGIGGRPLVFEREMDVVLRIVVENANSSDFPKCSEPTVGVQSVKTHGLGVYSGNDHRTSINNLHRSQLLRRNDPVG